MDNLWDEEKVFALIVVHCYDNVFYYCSLKTFIGDAQDDDKRPDSMWFQINQEMTKALSVDNLKLYPLNIKDMLICEMSREFMDQLKTFDKRVHILM